MSHERPWFVFSGGGTGGHLFPALAVISELRRAAPEADVTVLCTNRPIDRHILDRAGIEAVPQSVRPFTMKPWHWPGFWLAWRGAIRACEQLFSRRRPAVVVGAGGYASDPPVRAALKIGIPTAILNPDLVPGRANRRLGRRVDRVFAQWEGTARYLRHVRGLRAWGCPVRAAFATPRQVRREAGLGIFGLQSNRRTLLVTGASQGARTINDALIVLAPRLGERFGLQPTSGVGWQVVHLTGSADVECVRAAYEAAGLPAAVLAFTDHMAEAMAVADLAVSRAGASTLAELTVAGVASVLMPYPFHRDQHQMHNARELQQAGAAEIVEDRADAAANAGRLWPVLSRLMGEPAQLDAMVGAARRVAKPDAAGRIAEELLVLSRRGDRDGP